MQKALLFNIVKPYLTASAAMTAALLLIIGIYFIAGIESLWVALLWIFLIAAILGMIAQIVHTEIKIRNYKAQLATSKERLTNEIKHRLWAEKTTSESKIRLQFIDENIPVMLAYFNVDQRCRYHNRIFRQWFGLKPDQIDGHLLQDFSNKAFLVDIESHIEDAMNGKTIHNERILKSAKGFPYVFSEQFVPHMDSKGKVIGFYTLHTPRAQEKTRSSSSSYTNPDATHDISYTSGQEINPSSGTKNILTEKSVNQSSKENLVATRIMQAIDDGEFQLYCQKIMPLSTTPNAQPLYEILIRRSEEENNLMPPGAFLPLVEQYKMMPRLDRWVVNYLAHWLSKHQTVASTIFCINVAKDTLSDPDFPDFIQAQIQKTKIPAKLLCFEIEEMDAELNPTQTILLARKIKQLGCLVSLCSFSYSSLVLLKKIKIDFLKIDGSLICNMLQEEEDLKKVKAIYQIGRTIKAKTIAELVEEDEVIAKLREIGIDFAQGFGIAKPHPLKDVE